MTLIPAFWEAGRQAGQPGLKSEFKDNQGYPEEKTNNNNKNLSKLKSYLFAGHSGMCLQSNHSGG